MNGKNVDFFKHVVINDKSQNAAATVHDQVGKQGDMQLK